jgi:hypothetical protein
MRIEKEVTSYGPALSVTGVTKTHAVKAIRWLNHRNLLAFYSAADKSLNALEYPRGKEWTYDMLDSALRETK